MNYFRQYILFYAILISSISLAMNKGLINKRVKRIVGGKAAELPPEDDPVVYLHFAGKSASVRGVREFPHYVFRGIRFAHSPTGRDRFQVDKLSIKIRKDALNFILVLRDLVNIC